MNSIELCSFEGISIELFELLSLERRIVLSCLALRRLVLVV